MQIRKSVDIPKRYIQLGKYIVTIYDEISKVIGKAKNHFSLSADKVSRAYQKFYVRHIMFDTEWKTLLPTQSVDNTKFSIVTVEPLELAYLLKEIKNFRFEDITKILKNSICFSNLHTIRM